jgi:hypothetical protein
MMGRIGNLLPWASTVREGARDLSACSNFSPSRKGRSPQYFCVLVWCLSSVFCRCHFRSRSALGRKGWPGSATNRHGRPRYVQGGKGFHPPFGALRLAPPLTKYLTESYRSISCAQNQKGLNTMQKSASVEHATGYTRTKKAEREGKQKQVAAGCTLVMVLRVSRIAN